MIIDAKTAKKLTCKTIDEDSEFQNIMSNIQKSINSGSFKTKAFISTIPKAESFCKRLRALDYEVSPITVDVDKKNYIVVSWW